MSVFCRIKEAVEIVPMSLPSLGLDSLDIDKGSAQGSILGPFCYNVFTNDMLSIESDNIEIYNYADDNTVICSSYE